MSVTALLSKDDWIYTGILIGSFLLTWVIRWRGDVWILKNACGPLGFVMALLILGWKIFYSLGLALFVIGGIQFVSTRHLTSLIFVGSFAYMIALRYIHMVFDVDELASQANVVQLIMTLRVVGLAFEISDARLNSGCPPKPDARPKRYLTEEPSTWDIFNYLYHFAGLFTGPYYTYQMFLDSQKEMFITTWSAVPELTSRLLRLLWSVPIFVIVNKYYPLDGLRSDAVWEMSFGGRILYAAAVFVVFRTRVYSAWAIAESICVNIGLGIYPTASNPKCVVGPTDLEAFGKLPGDSNTEYNSEAIRNLDIEQIERSDGFRSGIRAWNRSVQSWLALYVHSRANRLYRVELTMFVSALWHGTYAGYFMSFLIVPMCAAVEDILFKYVPVCEQSGKRPLWFSIPYFLILRCRGFDMLATGFLLKNFADTHRFWSSLYYWLLLVTLPIYISHKIFVLLRKPKKVNLKNE